MISFYITILQYSEWFSNDNSLILNKDYDYIVGEFYILKKICVYNVKIVGSGSAGSVVALRLSERKDITVLVVEAGSYGSKLLDVPMEGPALQRTAADWQYKTIPQSTACFGLQNNVRNFIFYRLATNDRSTI